MIEAGTHFARFVRLTMLLFQFLHHFGDQIAGFVFRVCQWLGRYGYLAGSLA
jgi:hypothetical protein